MRQAAILTSHFGQYSDRIACCADMFWSSFPECINYFWVAPQQQKEKKKKHDTNAPAKVQVIDIIYDTLITLASFVMCHVRCPRHVSVLISSIAGKLSGNLRRQRVSANKQPNNLHLIPKTPHHIKRLSLMARRLYRRLRIVVVHICVLLTVLALYSSHNRQRRQLRHRQKQASALTRKRQVRMSSRQHDANAHAPERVVININGRSDYLKWLLCVCVFRHGEMDINVRCFPPAVVVSYSLCMFARRELIVVRLEICIRTRA